MTDPYSLLDNIPNYQNPLSPIFGVINIIIAFMVLYNIVWHTIYGVDIWYRIFNLIGIFMLANNFKFYQVNFMSSTFHGCILLATTYFITMI